MALKPRLTRAACRICVEALQQKKVRNMVLVEDRALTRYLHGYMLDYANFSVLEIYPQDKRFAAIIMQDRRANSPTPWCVQYGGGGHYFPTRGELDAYCQRRGWY